MMTTMISNKDFRDRFLQLCYPALPSFKLQGKAHVVLQVNSSTTPVLHFYQDYIVACTYAL